MTDPALPHKFARHARTTGLLHLVILVAGLPGALGRVLLPQPSVAATIRFAQAWLVQSANFPQYSIPRKVKP